MTAKLGVLGPTPFLPPPRPAEAMGIGMYFLRAVLNRHEIGGWVFEKNSLLQALKFW